MTKKNKITNETIYAPKPSSEEFVDAEKGYPATAKQAAKDSVAGISDNWQERYGDNRLVIMIRDPYWCFAYWDFSGEKQAEINREKQNNKARVILRIYDVTGIVFDGSNAHKTMDVEIHDEATNWYFSVWAAGCSCCADIGLLYADNHFVALIRSNIVTTPPDAISTEIDEEWMMRDETFSEFYRIAGAGEAGPASDVLAKYLLTSTRADVTSAGLTSMAHANGKPQTLPLDKFWLVVNTELIVYGATQPDANVTIQGNPIHLHQDGTFSVRCALPDGKQVILVKAVNKSGTHERQITPVVEKRTE